MRRLLRHITRASPEDFSQLLFGESVGRPRMLDPPLRLLRRPAVTRPVPHAAPPVSVTETSCQLLSKALEVETVGSYDGESGGLECLLPHVVLAVLRTPPVVLTVELGDKAGIFVEQVGDAEQSASSVEDRDVDSRSGKSGVDDVEDSQPRLPAAPRCGLGEASGCAGLGDARPAWMVVDVPAPAPQPHLPGVSTGVHEDNSLGEIPGATGAIERGAVSACHPDPEPHVYIVVRQALAGVCRDVRTSTPHVSPQGDGYWKRTHRVRVQSVQLVHTVDEGGRPSRHRSRWRDERSRVKDALAG